LVCTKGEASRLCTASSLLAATTSFGGSRGFAGPSVEDGCRDCQCSFQLANALARCSAVSDGAATSLGARSQERCARMAERGVQRAVAALEVDDRQQVRVVLVRELEGPRDTKQARLKIGPKGRPVSRAVLVDEQVHEARERGRSTNGGVEARGSRRASQRNNERRGAVFH
jgi:hypothetical protein